MLFKVNNPTVNGSILLENDLIINVVNPHTLGVVKNLPLIGLFIVVNTPTLKLSPIKDNSSVYFKLDILDVVINSIETNVGRSEILDFVLTITIPPHLIGEGFNVIVKPIPCLLEVFALDITYNLGASTDAILDILDSIGGIECLALFPFNTAVDEHLGLFPYYYKENMIITSGGKWGNCMYSDGVDDYAYAYFVEGEGEIGGEIDHLLTYSIHFLQEEVGNGGIIGQSDNDNGYSSWQLLSFDGTFQVGIFANETTYSLHDTGVPVNIGEWYHLTARVSPTGDDVLVYIDGVSQGLFSIKYGNYLNTHLVIGSARINFGSGLDWYTVVARFDQFRVFESWLNEESMEIVKDEASKIFDLTTIAYRDYPIDINVISNEILIDSPDNEVILVELFTLTILTFIPTFSGESNQQTPHYTDNKVFAQVIPLTLVTHYLQHPNNVYIQPQSNIINITPIMSNLWVTVHPKSFFIPININSSIAQNNNRDKRVLEIGNVQFDRALYWEKNIKVDEFIATTVTTVDGNTVYSIAPLKKYTRSYMISTKSDIIVDITKIEELKETITTDVILIKFTDGSWEHVKFDLTDVSIKFSPIFDGSDKYFLHIGVLL